MTKDCWRFSTETLKEKSTGLGLYCRRCNRIVPYEGWPRPAFTPSATPCAHMRKLHMRKLHMLPCSSALGGACLPICRPRNAAFLQPLQGPLAERRTKMIKKLLVASLLSTSLLPLAATQATPVRWARSADPATLDPHAVKRWPQFQPAASDVRAAGDPAG